MTQQNSYVELYRPLGLKAKEVLHLFPKISHNLDPNYDPAIYSAFHRTAAMRYAKYDPKFERTKEILGLKGSLSLESAINLHLIVMNREDSLGYVCDRLCVQSCDNSAEVRLAKETLLKKDVRLIDRKDIETIRAIAFSDKSTHTLSFVVEPTLYFAMQIATIQAILQLKGFTLPETRNVFLQDYPVAKAEVLEQVAAALRNDDSLLPKLKALAPKQK